MSLYKQFSTDKNLEKVGIVLEYGPNSKGEEIEIRIARAGGANKRYDTLLEVRLKPHRRQIQAETFSREQQEKIFLDVFAETVVLGWNNVEDADGNVMDFNKENVIKLFTDLPDLYEDVKAQSGKAALFRQQVLEEDAKN